MSSYALTALVLLRLHKEPGAWIEVAELARYMAVAAETVRHELECLAAAGDVEVQRDASDHITAARIAPGARADKAAPTPAPHPLPQHTHLERFERPPVASTGPFHPTEEPA